MTDLSIIIVCYKGWESLTKCLEPLSRFQGKTFTSEVIVVDNDSGDGHLSVIEEQFPAFQFIHNKINGGFANGNNLGATEAKGEFLLILNPDTVTTESQVEALLQTARSNKDYSIFSCRQINKAGREVKATGDFPALSGLTGFQRALMKFFKGRNRKESPDGEVIFPDWVSGSVIIIRKDLFMRLKGFYEGYWMYFEDVDLCKRVSDEGGIIAFACRVTIEHNHGGSSRINLTITSITKTEVLISQHVYISRHFKGIKRTFAHVILLFNNIITGFVIAIAGLIFFFIPKILVRTFVFLRLVNYYLNALYRRTWVSPRSVLYRTLPY